MEIKLEEVTGNFKSIDEMLRFSQSCGRQCYSDKDFEELKLEAPNPGLIQSTLSSGHHSVYEHTHLTFSMKGLPKIMAMVLNNEKQYVTSEKSARYTQMSDVIPEQREKYDKWMEILIPQIDEVFPKLKDKEKKKIAVKKLAQENARYMTSVFTPTKMAHTVNLRQLNFLMYEFDEFNERFDWLDENFKQKLIPYMEDFSNQTNKFKIENLKNQTDRHLSLFDMDDVEEHFGDTYSTSYNLSFAGLAQAHRHRTIDYHVSEGEALGAPLGFFVPKIIRDEPKLTSEWTYDLEEIAKDDFPQAQLLRVNEMGNKKDFKSKMMLRLCGHAQFEIMENTLETANKYAEFKPELAVDKKPVCSPKGCKSTCSWGNRYGITRKI